MELDDLLRETGELRAKMYKIWKAFEAKKISNAEAKLHISFTRSILETRRLEIASLYLAQQVQMPPAGLGSRPRLSHGKGN